MANDVPDPGPLAPLLTPLAYRGRAEEVAQRLTEAIQLGLLADGVQLPTELELAIQFGVSPMTLREALAQLRKRRLLVTKRGRTGGSFVCMPTGPDADELIPKLRQMSVTQLRDLGDDLAGVHIHAARLAAGRASQTNVRRLFALAEQLAMAGTPGERVRADSRFNIEVAMGSQSERLTRHQVLLQAEIAELLWLPIGEIFSVDDAVQRHHLLAKAIADEDAAIATALAEAEVDRRIRRLIQLRLDVDENKTEPERSPR